MHLRPKIKGGREIYTYRKKSMVIGFDQRNLSAAVSVTMAHALKVKQERYVESRPGGVYTTDLDNSEQVREMLMDRAEAFISQVPADMTGQILGMPYGHIGVVLEECIGETHPAPLSRSKEPVTHLAMFWAVL